MFTTLTGCLEFQVLLNNFTEKPKEKLPRTQNLDKSVYLKQFRNFGCTEVFGSYVDHVLSYH